MAKSYRVGEPVTGYVADEDRVRAKLFPNGRSQAIRLPKEFRMPGAEVWIHREGRRLVVEAVQDGERDAKGWPLGLWERIDGLMAGIAVPEIEPMPARLQQPEEIDPDVDWSE